MPVTIKQIADALETLAPLALQEDYDNAGLQVGLIDDEVTGVLLCLDITEDIVAEAVRLGCNLVVSHHPLIFRPLKRVTGATYQQRCVMEAVRHGIALYSAHTNGSWWAYFPVILTITFISFSLNLMNTGLDQVFNPTLRD